ncbi:MAG: hypothetical protein HYZ00_14840, partial [Candidatus Hydrogenedentes bacterium]|nr:hypothetical protein [Candidatus Hydrogenedentota bacterium]
RKGTRLQALITEECTATGLLAPASVRVRAAGGDAREFTMDKDYALDSFWGTLGRLEGGAIGPEQAVTVDYDYTPQRLDLVVLDSGKARLIEGTPGVGAFPPPTPPADAILLGTVWQAGHVDALSEENLFPVDYALPPVMPTPAAEQLLPNTLAKLRAGETVTIVAWGDSVTAGGGVGSDTAAWYQNQFVERLSACFPGTKIMTRTAAWPGAGSKQYLEAPAGGTYDFERDVMAPKPDLVTIEFVNDAYLDEAGVVAHYGQILERLRENGSEVILITPHLVRPDWMKVETLKFDEDPRPYVKGLRAFAATQHVALADASVLWCRLWRQGVPYMTRLSNSINHPDAPGHKIFADALMGVFPAR